MEYSPFLHHVVNKRPRYDLGFSNGQHFPNLNVNNLSHSQNGSLGGGESNTGKSLEHTQATQAFITSTEEEIMSPIRMQDLQQQQHWGRLVPNMTLLNTQEKLKTEITSPRAKISAEGVTFNNGGEVCTIGRKSTCTIPLNHLTVSSFHCSIGWWEPLKCAYVIDHKSSNGTFLNDTKLEPNVRYYLTGGDSICLVVNFFFSFFYFNNNNNNVGPIKNNL